MYSSNVLESILTKVSNGQIVDSVEEHKRAVKKLEKDYRQALTIDALGPRERQTINVFKAGLWLSSSWGEIALKIIGLAVIGAVIGGCVAVSYYHVVEGLYPEYNSLISLDDQWHFIYHLSLYGAAAGAALGTLVYLAAKIASHYNPFIKQSVADTVDYHLQRQRVRHNEQEKTFLQGMQALVGLPAPSLHVQVANDAEYYRNKDLPRDEDMIAYEDRINKFLERVEEDQRLHLKYEILSNNKRGVWLSSSWTRIVCITVLAAVIIGAISGIMAYYYFSPHDYSTSAKLLFSAKIGAIGIGGGIALSCIGWGIAKLSSPINQTKILLAEIEKYLFGDFGKASYMQRYQNHLIYQFQYKNKKQPIPLGQAILENQTLDNRPQKLEPNWQLSTVPL